MEPAPYSPSPGAPAKIEKSPDGRLQSLEQLGWKIEYQEYAEERPSRMRLVYPGIELRSVNDEEYFDSEVRAREIASEILRQ